MTFGNKLTKCHLSEGFTQTELAEKVGVSPQTVEEWEQGVSFPDREKALGLCKLFSVSADDLHIGKEIRKEKEKGPTEGEGYFWGIIRHPGQFRFEFISKKRVGELPLVHINVGLRCAARGVFAVGFVSVGVFALGLVSVGVFALGLIAAGLLAVGLLALGGAALGFLSVGIVTAGIFAAGVLSAGIFAAGQYGIGGLAAGRYVVGGWVHGYLAIGKIRASGEHAFLIPEDLEELEAFLKLLPERIERFFLPLARAMR